MSRVDWTRVPERGSQRLLVFGVRLMNVLGYRAGILMAWLTATYCCLTSRSSRRASREYLARLYSASSGSTPAPSTLHAIRHHGCFAATVVDRFWFWQGKLDQFQVSSIGSEHILHRKRGALIVSAHLGLFDVMRAVAQSKEVPLTVVMHRTNARRFNAVLDRFGSDARLDVVELGDDITTAIRLKQKIDRGELVALLADRITPGPKERTITVPLFGSPAAFPQGPWLLASLLECEVLFAHAVRSGPRRYVVSVEPLFPVVKLPRGSRTEAMGVYLLEFARKLEEVCRRAPYQWFNFFDFWGRPEGSTAKVGGAGAPQRDGRPTTRAGEAEEALDRSESGNRVLG